MSLTLTSFIAIIAIGSVLNIILTQAIKTTYRNAGKQAPPNIIALIDAAVCGGGVTAVFYMLMGIPWTINNIIVMLCIVFFNWLGATEGYDKVIQTAEQIGKIASNVEKVEEDTKVKDEDLKSDKK